MKNWPFLSILLVVAILFWQFFSKGLLPIPADTIVGLYHPFRDVYAKDYPRGIPFKNFLITDPVRQQYPWRSLSIELEKRLELPLWNPYNFSGTPLLANFQSAVFYPLNILFFILPFQLAWSLQIVLGPLLAGFFMYLFLRDLKLNKIPSVFGAIAFSLSGFFVAWLEWGVISHTALWLPLILLSVNRVTTKYSNKWAVIFVFSLVSSFFAGHLQIFFYLLLVSISYLLFKSYVLGIKNRFRLIGLFLIAALATLIQWFPTLKFISLSGRELDQINWQREGWFIPWQNLVQFFAPDFFGNPTTLNYWGIFNYGEFIGYVGILSIVFSLFALISRRDRETLFFGALLIFSLLFSLPTFLAKLPYILDIPLISSSQPTRLLFVVDFSLAVIAALGLDLFLKSKKRIAFPVITTFIIFAGLWVFVRFGSSIFDISPENLKISQRNLIFPTLIFFISVFLIYASTFLKSQKIKRTIYFSFLVILCVDLLRFASKFEPFVKSEYLYPESKAIVFLKNDNNLFRIMTDDSRILPPNFSIMYKIQSVDGYDPLFVGRYAELISASERGEPNIKQPLGFNRIITPHNFESKIIDFLGVKYILSLKDLESAKLDKVYQEGETRIYKNKNYFPRVFFVENVIKAGNKQESIEKVFEENLQKTAIVEGHLSGKFGMGKVDIVSFSENKILLKTENNAEGFLVIAETFYPAWKAKIDGKDTKIYRTNFNFRGIVVPNGSKNIELYMSIL